MNIFKKLKIEQKIFNQFDNHLKDKLLKSDHNRSNIVIKNKKISGNVQKRFESIQNK